MTEQNNKKNQGYLQKKFRQPVKRYCQTLDLKDDPELIARYVEAHSRYKFQACKEGSTSDEKWQLMDRIFYLYE